MRRLRRERGYTLVAIMVGLTVMSIMIAAVLPLASMEMQRDREEELIFRGRQYAEGIRAFRRKFGRYPNNLREMLEVQPRTLRKLWKDPITNSLDWGLVSLLAPVPTPPGGGTGKGGSGSSGSSGFGGSGFGGGKGEPTPVPTPTPGPDGSGGKSGGSGGSGGAGGSGGSGKGGHGKDDDTPVGPVTGVYSKSTKTAYRFYQGKDKYNEWRFTEATLNAGSGGPETPGGGPGPGIGGGGTLPPGGSTGPKK